MPHQTTALKNDIVLKSASVMLTLGKWITIGAIAILVLALPALFIFQGDITSELTGAFAATPGQEFFLSAGLLIFIGIGMLLLTFFTIDRLRKIVGSVQTADPFTRTNGVRLRGMGIAILLMHILGFVGGLVGQYALSTLGKPVSNEAISLADQVSAEISLSGILLVLLLILLARIFDRGADMQEELDGTI